MPGCKGSCNFSNKRNNEIKCEGECKEEYIETSEGICELCNIANKGCERCHYEDEYPIDFYGIKRERRFICDICEEGYEKINGKCILCSDLVFQHCKKCNKNINNEFKCSQCSDGYFFNNKGYCEICDFYQIKGKNNKCIYCDNTDKGGMKDVIYVKKLIIILFVGYTKLDIFY